LHGGAWTTSAKSICPSRPSVSCYGSQVDERQLAACFERGTAAWPQIPCDAATFQRVAHAWQQRTGRPLDAANARDLYLAAAITDRVAPAYAAFERSYLERTKSSLARLGLRDGAVDDVLQIVREKLLLATAADALPKLATMAGDGQLEALVRVVVVRTGHNFRRDQKLDRFENEDDIVIDRIATEDESLAGKDARKRLRDALRTVLAELPARDRTLLRLHFYRRMSIDELGNLYDVHRATAARWLTRIFDEVEQRVSAAYRGTQDESLPSILAIVRSHASGWFSDGSK
jgi:RNA polymerase sigma-70 factor (ECF subfamily)